jgi:hypothetical protein
MKDQGTRDSVGQFAMSAPNSKPALFIGALGAPLKGALKRILAAKRGFK